MSCHDEDTCTQANADPLMSRSASVIQDAELAELTGVQARHVLWQIGRKPVSFVGRYNCTYNNIAKPAWWDTLKSGGCIVEQATHFVDAMRYLSRSEFRRDSIQAVGVGPDMELSDMPPPPRAEHTVRSPSPRSPPLHSLTAQRARCTFNSIPVLRLRDSLHMCLKSHTQSCEAYLESKADCSWTHYGDHGGRCLGCQVGLLVETVCMTCR